MSSKFGKVLAAATSNEGDNSSLSGVVKQLRRVQMLDRFAARLKELAVQAQDAVSIDSAMNSSSILVAVRLRPFLPHDKTYDTKETCLEIEGNNIDIEDVRVEEQGHRESKPHHFKFDVFLPSNVTQQRVYVATAKRILVKVLKGYNGTIFTYGQTGSGKTHTMLGDDKDPGIIPRVGKDLMAEIKRMAGKTAFKVQASFVEIYREKIADLIAGVNEKQIQHDKERNSQSSVLKAVAKMRRNSVEHRGKDATMKAASSFLRAHFHDHPEKKKKKKGQDLKVRESKHGVEIIGVSMHPVNSNHDIMYLLDLGNNSRHVASHALNSASSRSHCIFTLYIEQSKVSASGQATRLKSKFNLIDLAGSERAERTGATGDLLKEGASINRSLSALGNVIKVLTDSKKKKKKGGKIHVPYRDSMLTRLLSDSLGGTASTLMCCNLAPGSDHYFETLSSLEFAKRVKKVKNTVTLRTEKLSQKEAKAMVKDADQVRQQMAAMQLEHEKELQSKKLTLSSDATNELKLLRKEMEHHKKKNEALHKISKATAANDRSILSDEGQTTTKTITDSDFARLFFVNTNAHSMSYIDYDRSEPTFEIGRGIIGRVAQTGETMFAPMAPEHDLFDPAVDEGSLAPTDVIGPLLAVPIIDEDGTVIGVMATGRRPGGEPFSQDDALLLQSICQHIAHAVHSHDSAGKNGGKLTLTTLTVSEAGQKFHNTMMQIAAMCETRSKMAALTEELIEDMIGGAHGTLFFIGGAPDMDEDDKHVWSMHMNASPATLITGMPGIVGDCVRSHETVNIATSNDHQEYHEKFDAHPHHSPGAASAHVHATMCVPIYKTMGEPSSGVLAAIRVMRSDATGAFGREDAAVIELLAPYVSSGLQRILKNDHHMRTSLQVAQQLEDMTSRMEEVHRDRDAQENETQALQAEIRKRDEEMKQMNKDMKKVGIASGARSTLKLALEHKKASQAQAMQASLNAELEMMRQNKHVMEEEFEKAKNQLKKAEQGRKVLKKRHMSVKATQLFNAVDGKQKEKALLKAQLMTDLANKEKKQVQQKLSMEQAKTKRLQKAHELEVKKFHEEVKKHEEDLRKKKIALEKSMEEAKNKHAKKLVALKSKLRRFKSQSNMHQDAVKLERNRRLSMQLRNSFKDMKQSRLNETLETMEEELQKQQRRYNLGSVQEHSDDDSDDDSGNDQDASHGSHRGASKQDQKSNQTRTPRTTHYRDQKRNNSPESSNHKSQGIRQPLPPSKGFMNGAVTNNNVSRHNKLLRGLMQMSPAKTPRSSKVGKVYVVNKSKTLPTMCPSAKDIDDGALAPTTGVVANNFCVAVDGSNNSWAALQCVLTVFCNRKQGKNKSSSVEVVHVAELNAADLPFDLQPAFVKKETLNTLDLWHKQKETMEEASNPESVVVPATSTSYVEAVRCKSDQSVPGTLAYHTNEVARPRFLVSGLVGAGGAAEHMGGCSDRPGSIMAHNLWCSRCTSIVVSPTIESVINYKHKKYVVAVDGSGRSFHAFQDVCALCNVQHDTIVVVHVMMSRWKNTMVVKKAAAAIEKFYLELLPKLGMPGRVSYQCVQVDCSLENQYYTTLGESIASFATQEQATFLAVGIDGTGVWNDGTLQWQAKQKPAPGKIVRYLSLLQNAPCSLIVNCT